MKVILLGAFIVTTAVSGCATITQGTRSALMVESNPSGASVLTTSGYSCIETPCVLDVPKKDSFSLTMNKQGCKPKTVNIVSTVGTAGGAALAGNIILGGIVGLGVDAATGASKELVPNPVKADLEC